MNDSHSEAAADQIPHGKKAGNAASPRRRSSFDPSVGVMVSMLIVAGSFVAGGALRAAPAVDTDRREEILDSSLSATQRLDALVETVRAVHASLETLESQFVQIKESQLLVGTSESSGFFVYRSPDQVRWDYVEPEPISLVIRDRVMTTWYRDMGQVERASVGKRSDQVLRYLGASTSLDTLLEYFSVSLHMPAAEGDPLHLELLPRFEQVAKRLASMDLWLHPEYFLPVRLRYVEGDGDLTEYRFSDLRMNQSLPEGRFELVLPDGVNVRLVELEGRSGSR